MASQYTRRDYAPYSLVHFTVRGLNRRRIFLDERDHADFLWLLRDRLDRFSSPAKPALLAYAQMDNHQHVFIQHGNDGTAGPALMRSISTSYAIAHNERYRLTGKVFQRPFRGKVIRGGDYIANTFAYIHLNPDASLRVTNSSHAFYAGLSDDPHIDPTLAWRVFGGPAGYAEFFADTARLRAARAAARRRLGE